ncbi:MAG TPA: PAS domain S-box protein [Gemmatimonadaceae bacterium]|nr:PAS domain S-box protein [Gemmatimonadaceae bacterium]
MPFSPLGLSIEEEIRFRSEILDAVGQAVIATDLDGRVIYWNHAAETLFGFTEAEMLGQKARVLVPTDQLDYAEVILERIRAGEVWSGEFLVRRKDGTLFTAYASDALLRDRNGNVVGVVGLLTDLTPTKRVEERLRKSEALLAESQRIAKIGSWEWDPATDALTCSEEWRRMFGYEPGDEVTVASMWQAIHQDDRERMTRVTREARASGCRFEYEFLIPGPQGARTIHCIGRVIRDEQGQAIRLVGTNQDVTERRRAEEALRRSEERLHRSERLEAVGQLAGGIAHDFNNLLTAITSYTQLLLEDFSPNDGRRDDLLEIKKAADRATSLTRQLLAFSRRQVLDPRVIDLNAVVADLENMLRRLIGAHIALVTDPAVRPPLPRVHADVGQLEQVIVNLAVNARDAMADGGTLTIRTGQAQLTEADCRDHADFDVHPGRYVVMSVSDTGTGMDAATQARMFEPFFTTKGPGKGTGLGLATVYGIVKQSGGYIAVTSEPGKGTTFRIYLPAVADAAPGASAAGTGNGADAMPNGSGTILLVEDETPVRTLARRVLEQAGYAVLEAEDGVEGVRVADGFEGEIDLLLTDVVMPNLGGRALVERLRAKRPRMAVLFISGYPDGEVERGGLTNGGATYLEKPFSPRMLRDTVRQALEDARNPVS